jgi:hypothetical protein
MGHRAFTLLALVGALALPRCHSTGGGSPSDGGAVPDDPASSAAAPALLPPPCVEFLGQLQCWLRASGNDARDVDRAVGLARASFEARPSPAGACEHAMVFRAEMIGAAGCAHAAAALGQLPPSASPDCPPGEFFFLRRDGRISGCHRDCTLPSDCPAGSSCKSVGTAPGGPVDENFCE